MVKEKKHRFKSLRSKILLVLVLFLLLVTVPPKNAVRFSMILSGASPRTALTCNPKYDKIGSKSMQTDAYIIPLKDAYEPLLVSNGSKLNTFKVFSILFLFHVAVPVYPY